MLVEEFYEEKIANRCNEIGKLAPEVIKAFITVYRGLMPLISAKKILIDVDTGIDDAFALLLLLKYIPEKLIGITTCGGNADVKQVTRNTLGVVELADSKTPVYQGATKPLIYEKYIYAADYHGRNGLCGFKMRPKSSQQSESAVDFMVNSLKKYGRELLIICTAPPTNLALALKKQPVIAGLIKSVLIMGGVVDVPGNETKSAEFNFYQDPHALKTVLDGVKSVYIVPLDVTRKCLISPEKNKKFNMESPVSNFVGKIIERWYKHFGDRKGRFFELYDPLAVSVVLKDFLSFKREKFSLVTVGRKRGALIRGNDYSIYYANTVRAQNFVDFFVDSINSY